MDNGVFLVPDRRRSPLHDLRDKMRDVSRGNDGAVTLREISFLTQLNLRGDAGNPAISTVVREVLELDLPTKPNSSSASSLVTALWLAPDEWLLVGRPGIEERMTGELRQKLHGLHASVVDVSAARVAIELGGDRSRELLAKGCSLDLHPRVFRAGGCAQTHMARANVILQQLDDKPTWLVYVRASFAGYLGSWLIDAARDFPNAKRCDKYLEPVRPLTSVESSV